MNVWLINPPVIRNRRNQEGAVARSLFYNSPPLGLAYMAAVLERAGHRVMITDCPVERLTAADLGRMAPAIRPDLVGLTATTPYIDQAAAAGDAIRASLPDLPICLGGAHINANPEDLLKLTSVSFAALGEGEITLLEAVGKIANGEPVTEVPGIVTRSNGSLHFAARRPLIDDLDDLPMPARHLLPMRSYVPMPNDQYALPKASIISSRGCPFACTFCDHNMFGTRYRSFSPGRIVEEMHHLESRYGIRDIAFVDSTFTPNRRRVEKVLDAMDQDPPKASWTCSCRANVLDEDLMHRMRRLGCWRIRIGIESGNEGILKSICKGITKEDVRQAVETGYRLGFQLKSFFIVGHVGETKETIEDSIRFALSLPLKDVTVQINTPLRGTRQYEEARTRGTIATEDLTQYSFFTPVFVPEGMTVDELVRAHRRFYRRFYLRPVIVWRHVKSIRGWSDVTKYLRAIPLVVNLLFRRNTALPE